MDGRETMAFPSGSSSYYIHRGSGILGSGSGSQHDPLHPPTGFRSLSSPHLASQSNVRPGSSAPAFSIEPLNANFGHGINMAATSEVQVGEPVKKKRGRPRKYGLDGQVSLGLSSLPDKAKPSSGEDSSTSKRNRGRPPGSGRKQQLATLGEWMNSSAGLAFSPHVVSIGVGEDIVSKLLSFSQQRPRAVCILSGTGTVSSVTLRQPASSGPSITFEGRFEILCLSGSYLVAEDGGPHNRTGVLMAMSLVVQLQCLFAASPVQSSLCSLSQLVHWYEAQKCKPSGKERSPENECNQDNGAECCERRKILHHLQVFAIRVRAYKGNFNNKQFEEGGDGGGPSECDGRYQDDGTPVVALSTGWFGNKKRCSHHITINGNGRSVKALVVDHCDSTMGCDGEHGYQPPCPNNIVDASKAVWKALGVNEKDKEWGWMDVTWSDA
ncbi:LOW QUALITY PROTEIN: AT-hook motif nuclear-localized protein 5-like [Populus alba x Populus x berolinensis]|nr:LOW QUALITY PROTEIN: AT-hook motif nuclear-localized protein 5-like [Populus alba x Populus x berolinensis]